MAIKSTSLSFGLVNVPVRLEKAKETKERGLKLASPEGKAVKQVYIVEETGEVVGSRSDCVRGIFDGPDFHEVPKDALAAIDGEGKIESLVVDNFIPLSDVPTERIEGCYFIAPSKESGSAGTKSLALLREGLAATATAGIGKMTLRTKQRPFVVFERDGAIIVNILGFADAYEALDIARAKLAEVEVDDKTVGLFKVLVENLSTDASKLDEYRDDVAPKREALIDAAVAGEAIEVQKVDEEVAATVDLEAALLASIAA